MNNTAVIKSTTSDESDDGAFDIIFSVNVRGMVSFTRSVSQTMIVANVAGSIVNMSSITAAQGAPNVILFSASEGAISTIARSTAIEFVDSGIGSLRSQPEGKWHKRFIASYPRFAAEEFDAFHDAEWVTCARLPLWWRF